MSVEKTDAIAIVRVCMKIADSLDELDYLKERIADKRAKVIRMNFKTELLSWGTVVENFSNVFLKAFSEANDKLAMSLQQAFLEFSKGIFIESEEITWMCLLYCKAASILNDINVMTYSDAELIKVRNSCERVKKSFEAQYPQFFKIKDEKGNGLNEMVLALNRLGHKIMYADDVVFKGDYIYLCLPKCTPKLKRVQDVTADFVFLNNGKHSVLKLTDNPNRKSRVKFILIP